MKRFLLFVMVLSLCDRTYAQINVASTQTASALATKLVGQGVTISNPVLNCMSIASGLFTATNSNLGLDSGIVLTTGRAATQGSYYGVNGPSTAFASSNNGWPGDPMLNALAGRPTFDACSLEFDVVPNGDTVRFSYVFSSEEYISAVCGSYNDAFAFFISGPGIAVRDNMALVPGANKPVTINSINDGIPGSSGNLYNCTVMGPGSPFTVFYTDNLSGTTLTHQGLTKVLEAKHAVVPCSTYHLKVVIADAGNATYDSGVFLKARSLETNNYSVRALTQSGVDTAQGFCVKGCLPGRFIIKRSQTSGQPQTIKFFTGGNAISGVDYSPVVDSVVIPANSASAVVTINGLQTGAGGARILKLFVLSGVTCTGISNIADSASMVIYDSLHITNGGFSDTAICAGDSVLMQIKGDDIYSYSWTPAEGLSNSSIKDPVAFPAVDTKYEVTAYLPGTSCQVRKEEVFFRIKLTPHVYLNRDTTVCYNASVPLNAVISVANEFDSYLWTGPDNFTSTLLHPVVNKISAPDAGIYRITVTNDTNGCHGGASIFVDVDIPPMPLVNSPVVLCRSPLMAEALKAEGEGLLWYTPSFDSGSAHAPTPRTMQIANYRYYVTQTPGNCESPKAQVDVEVKQCCDGVINIPTAFTPNGDGHNDQFRILMGYGYFVEQFYIYNRWGQIVYSGLDRPWDGTYNGIDAPAGTYYYNITLGCLMGGMETRKGDVILIR